MDPREVSLESTVDARALLRAARRAVFADPSTAPGVIGVLDRALDHLCLEADVDFPASAAETSPLDYLPRTAIVYAHLLRVVPAPAPQTAEEWTLRARLESAFADVMVRDVMACVRDAAIVSTDPVEDERTS